MALVNNNRNNRALVADIATAMGPIVARVAAQTAGNAARGLGRRALRRFEQLTQGQALPKTKIEEKIVIDAGRPQVGRRGRRVNRPARGKTNTVTITREELCSKMTSPGVNVGIKRFPLSPESDETFPWLSNIARNFTQYRFRNIRFRYVPQVGVYSSSSLVGSIVLAYDPDPSELPLNSRDQIVGLDSKAVQILSEATSLSTNSAKLLDWYDVGSTTVSNELFAEQGVLYTCITNSPVTEGSQVGDLYVSYTIEFRKPRVNDSGEGTQIAHFWPNGESASATNRFGNTGVIFSPGNKLTLGVDYTVGVNSVSIFTPGTYMILVYWSNSDTTITATASVTLSQGCVAKQMFGYTAGNFTVSSLGTVLGSTGCVQVNTFTYANDGMSTNGLLTYSGLTSMTLANYDVFLVQLPSDLTMAPPSLVDQVARRLGLSPQKIFDNTRCRSSRPLPPPAPPSDQEGFSPAREYHDDIDL